MSYAPQSVKWKPKGLEIFHFTCNEYRIYESLPFRIRGELSQGKKHLIFKFLFWDSLVCRCTFQHVRRIHGFIMRHIKVIYFNLKGNTNRKSETLFLSVNAPSDVICSSWTFSWRFLFICRKGGTSLTFELEINGSLSALSLFSFRFSLISPFSVVRVVVCSSYEKTHFHSPDISGSSYTFRSVLLFVRC